MTAEKPVRRTSTIGRIVAVIIAILLAPPGLWVLWVGGADVFRAASAHRGMSGIGILLAVIGVVLLLAVVQTARLSSLGLGLVGLAVTVFAVIVIVWPSGATATLRFFRGFSPDLAYGAGQWMYSGLVLGLGLVLWGAAAAARIARRATEVSSASALRGMLSILFAVIGSALGLGLLWGGGSLVNRATQNAVGISVTGIVYVVLGAVVLAGAVLTAVISSAGIFLVGAVLFVVGSLAFVIENVGRVLANAVGPAGPHAVDAAYLSYELGFVATLGAVLLATATVVRRNRRALTRGE